MSAPSVIRAADGEAVAARAAQMLAELLSSTLTSRASAHLALSGGTTPAGAYRALRLPRWEGIELWFGDERCVGPEDPQSNYLMAERTLLDHAPGALVHRIEGELGAERAAAAYAELLRERVGGDGGAPVLDIVLLGIGEDGHTASLFPHHPALDASGAVCVAVHDAPKPPPDRVSLSLEVLRAARSTILLATGAAKAHALARALGEADPAVPASLLERERLTVIADAAALADA
ncbi:MAG TPA: 6-phosphogluconolactonase [Solirubrobacteraceae bacterium]|nr:6-phosphogluconolactonase [Solirubrobacteraceae bacterium]